MTLLLLQMAIVVLTALVCGSLARRLGQASVIGEIVGGILLGPSVFGRFAPHLSSVLFPQQSFGSFEVLSNIGLILFLFLIGAELDYEHLHEQKITATLTSMMSILLPFALAILVAPSLRSRFAPEGVGALPFTLFLGISLSITAFPVLARILEERGLQSTSLGATALMCAAVDDVCAWSLLAVALALIQPEGSTMTISHRLLWLVAYIVGMVCLVRPLGRWLARRWTSPALSYGVFSVILAVVLASAAATEAIGVHPLFGAFLAGLCLPRVKGWQSTLRTRLDVVVSVLLLPLFFALTGMRTRLDLLSGTTIWLWTALVLLVAVVGKMGGAVLASRWTGQPWRYSWALGALLNTRGLVELIVLNIAYKAHVFSPTLFTMLVVMALITTMMTTPILNWLGVGGRNIESRSTPTMRSA
ncbi:cation:proton antiporter [Edaphobacter modestus]|uniref:Kef-type K+ transport system membrane component KefB n=1 Tax=Edaphobacter modestus TaxID=388466 RepID=A0A4V2G4J5_9BACT|nr:cation:proton antiporter [Edaphobacter modestus]RZU41156.1 Kef-type K+ transport system membrane component KefB [Edaphobacter modestus]